MHIESSGRELYKKGSSGWYRIFGDITFKKGVYKWCLHIVKYTTGDKSGITYGICEEGLAQSQKTKTSFNYSSDINVSTRFIGIGGSQNKYSMKIHNGVSIKSGDRLYFHLDLKKSFFKIFLNTKTRLLAEATSLKKN